MRTLVQAALLTLGGAVVGIAANALSPRPAAVARPVHAAAEATAGACEIGPAGAAIPRIETADAEALCAACTAAFVDARAASEYEAGHVPGAIHLPPTGHAQEAAAIAQLSRSATIVVYDGDPGCALAEGVAHRLRKSGFADVRVLSGAWPAWVTAGGPGASGPCSICNHTEKGQR